MAVNVKRLHGKVVRALLDIEAVHETLGGRGPYLTAWYEAAASIKAIQHLKSALEGRLRAEENSKIEKSN